MLIRSCILLALVVESGHGLRADVLYDVVDICALPGLGNAFLYSNGHMMDLGVADSAGNDINNSGQITGYYGVDNVRHAFLYSDGRVTNLGALGGAGFALNDAGEVTGVADTTTTENGTPHA